MSPICIEPDGKEAARFWEQVDRGNRFDCWEWKKGRLLEGYGRFWTDGRYILAHRFAWELANGPIPDGLFVCHHCDNPPCANPDHLFVATSAENTRDAARKSRLARGATNASTKLTEAQVVDIKSRIEEGESRKAIARLFDVSPANIDRIAWGQTWAWVK